MIEHPISADGTPFVPCLANGATDVSLRRRNFLRSIVAIAGAAVSAHSFAAEKPASGAQTDSAVKQRAKVKAYFVYVGCRTTKERNARGEGINVYRMDAATGRCTHVQLAGGLVNPSFLAFDRRGRFLYTVHGDSSEISAFKIDDRTGEISFINQRSTKGKNPVHLSFDPSNRFVVVANHITSTLAVLPVNQ